MTALWEATLEAMKPRVSAETFASWFQSLRFVAFESPVLRLSVPHRFFADWLSARHVPDLVAVFSELSGQTCTTIDWVVNDVSVAPPRPQAVRTRDVVAARRAPNRAPRESHSEPLSFELPPAAPAPASAPPSVADSALNPRYDFDSFVVGASNQLAHAAATAAASSPGRRYNPLFIYSRSGLGKTHLVNAVGNTIRKATPSARIHFLSAERFTNEFILALAQKRIDQFHSRYRSQCDVLILDDIQFLATREQTQQEFFHTFNALYHADKQIIVTSDVNPQQLAGMEERLVSRFQWGLIADIQAPELDTRIAILRKKAEVERIDLADEVALFVAQRVQSNVRELEGTLLRLAMRAEVERRGLDLSLARAMLGEGSATTPDRAVSVEDIQKATCEYFGLSMKELLGDRRHRGVSQPRMVAMYVARERLRLSFPELGRRFGGKDHTTVISGCRKIEALLPVDEQLRRAVETIERKLGLGRV